MGQGEPLPTQFSTSCVYMCGNFCLNNVIYVHNLLGMENNITCDLMVLYTYMCGLMVVCVGMEPFVGLNSFEGPK